MAIYLKFDGIDGEATHDKHQQWIDIDSVQFGFGRAISTQAGAAQNREASEPSISEVTVTKTMDNASPKLFTESVTGNKGKEVKIHMVSTGSPGVTYAEYTLTNALISGYSVASGGERPNESLSISFTKMEYKLTPFDSNHEAGTPVTVSYDLATTKSG